MHRTTLHTPRATVGLSGKRAKWKRHGWRRGGCWPTQICGRTCGSDGFCWRKVCLCSGCLHMWEWNTMRGQTGRWQRVQRDSCITQEQRSVRDMWAELGLEEMLETYLEGALSGVPQLEEVCPGGIQRQETLWIQGRRKRRRGGVADWLSQRIVNSQSSGYGHRRGAGR